MSIRFGIVFIPAKHIRTLNGDLATMIGTEMISVLVHDADAQAGAHSHRTRLAVSWRQRVRGHLVRRFGHAVGFDERNAKESLYSVNQLRRQRRAAGTDEAERGGLCWFLMR